MDAFAAPATLRENEQGNLVAYAIDENGHETEVTWSPQAGSQVAFDECPIFETLYEGTRGPGKTDSLLMSFAKHVGQGWGEEWKGILFRRTYPELSDVIDKSKKWFPRVIPGAKFTASPNPQWTFPEGEQLLFRNMAKPDDYWDYHGHAYPWIGWEELTTWPDLKCYKLMMSVNRSTVVDMPRMYRATCNPYGVGHNAVKAHFKLPIPPGRVVGPIIRDTDEEGNVLERVAIHGHLLENQVLLHAEPGYRARIRAAALNQSMEHAWLHGSWDITSGGMFDDLWRPLVHTVDPFPVPGSWIINRSFDWGDSKPFSVGWWAESDGTDRPDGTPTRPGDLYRIGEWYGWNGNENEGLRMSARNIALGIREREDKWWPTREVEMGPADTSIFAPRDESNSMADDMAEVGVYWQKAAKESGSRERGWQKIRALLEGALESPREKPGIFIFNTCDQFIRTFPVLPRSTSKLDDVDTEQEDHIGDETRYRVYKKPGRLAVMTDFQGR